MRRLLRRGQPLPDEGAEAAHHFVLIALTPQRQEWEKIGWSEKQSIQGRELGGWFQGIGIASFVESGAGGLKEHARIKLNPVSPLASANR